MATEDTRSNEYIHNILQFFSPLDYNFCNVPEGTSRSVLKVLSCISSCYAIIR